MINALVPPLICKMTMLVLIQFFSEYIINLSHYTNEYMQGVICQATYQVILYKIID